MKSPTYYEVLGLQMSATPADIRRRYRELARRYHPDVSTRRDANERFVAINEAHMALSDPVERAAYDARLLKEESARKARTATSATHVPSTAASQNAPRPARQKSNPPRDDMADEQANLLVKARQAAARLRYREAEMLCRQAMRLNRRNPEPYEILGDLHKIRGRIDEAVAMYSYAIQLDPRRSGARNKFDSLTGHPAKTIYSRHTASSSKKSNEKDHLSLYRTVSIIGVFLIIFLGYTLYQIPGAASMSWFFWQWDPLALFALATSGLLVGLLMSVNGWIGSAKEELGRADRKLNGQYYPAIGPWVIGSGILSYYITMILYFFIEGIRFRLSRSISRAFGISAGMILVSALIRPESFLWILACSGNLLFPSFCIGWIIGDKFKSNEAGKQSYS